MECEFLNPLFLSATLQVTYSGCTGGSSSTRDCIEISPDCVVFRHTHTQNKRTWGSYKLERALTSQPFAEMGDCSTF